MEILAESEEEVREHALFLIELGAKQASSRLRFARMAYGASGPAGDIADLAEIKSILDDFLDDGKVSLAWESAHDGLRKDFVRVLMNLVLIGAGCIPRGGTISVNISHTSGPSFMSLAASGEGARLKPDIRRALNCAVPVEDLDVLSIQPFFTGLLIRSNRIQLNTDQQDKQVIFQVSS